MIHFFWRQLALLYVSLFESEIAASACQTMPKFFLWGKLRLILHIGNTRHQKLQQVFSTFDPFCSSCCHVQNEFCSLRFKQGCMMQLLACLFVGPVHNCFWLWVYSERLLTADSQQLTIIENLLNRHINDYAANHFIAGKNCFSLRPSIRSQ